jgi:hypothetical protein
MIWILFNDGNVPGKKSDKFGFVNISDNVSFFTCISLFTVQYEGSLTHTTSYAGLMVSHLGQYTKEYVTGAWSLAPHFRHVTVCALPDDMAC